MNELDISRLSLAPSWSLAVGELGRGLILFSCLAFAASILAGLRFPQGPWSRRGFTLGTLGFFGAFACLAVLFATDQFQFFYVYSHSGHDHELRYKLAAVWSGQQGSFLLWAVTSSIFGLLAVGKTGACQRWFTILYSGFLLALAGILSFETPFSLIPSYQGRLYIPPDGAGLAPSLLNYWVTIHPPTIFMGFGSLTVLFAWAVSALITGDLEGWIKPVRPWALTSLALLGLGLGMGGFWAYETLNWGGFWMWDPVENTSFVPWCAAAALVHGAFIQTARRRWIWVNPLLAAAPFLLFLYGTFLTRSGFLGDTSVHSFAKMDSKALQLLVGVFALAVGSAAWAYIRARRLYPATEPKNREAGVLHREAFYTAAVWLLFAFGLVTAIGMSVPLIMALSGKAPKVVEEHLYHQILAWPFPALALLMAIGPFLTWKASTPRAVSGRLLNVVAVTLGAVGFLLLAAKQGYLGVPADPAKMIHFFGSVSVPSGPWVMFLAGLCLFAIFANVLRLVQLWPTAKYGVGGVLSHVGVMVMMLGLIYSRGFEQKQEVTANSARPVEAFGYEFQVIGPTSKLSDRNNKIALQVQRGPEQFVSHPGLYYLPAKEQGGDPVPMVWPDIKFHPGFDLYVVVHPLTYEASDPATLKKGEVGVYNGIGIKYDGLRTEGPLGQVGAKFIADVTVDSPSGTAHVSPSLKIVGPGKFEYEDPLVTSDYKLHLESINAADKSASLSFSYVKPAYPLDIFYKPLVVLVWAGVGIMTLGAGLSALGRRYRPGKNPTAPQETPSETTPEAYAPQPTAQI